MKDTGKFHLLKWGGAQITLPKNLVEQMGYINKEKLLLDYDSKKKELRISKL